MTTFSVPAFKSSLCHWGLQFDDFIVKSDGNTAAHGDNHGFAVKEFRAFLVVSDDIPRQIFQTFRMPTMASSLVHLALAFWVSE